MEQQAINQAMEAKLKAAGLGFESIKVFGVIRQNVHITCQSRDTADKWAQLLGGVFKGGKVNLVPTRWNAANNTGTSMRPTMRNGYLVAVVA